MASHLANDFRFVLPLRRGAVTAESARRLMATAAGYLVVALALSSLLAAGSLVVALTAVPRWRVCVLRRHPAESAGRRAHHHSPLQGNPSNLAVRNFISHRAVLSGAPRPAHRRSSWTPRPP